MILFIEFIESDSSRKNLNRIAILVLTSPINSVNPLNIEKSLTINDILRKNTSKPCLHIRILEKVGPEYYSPMSKSTIFERMVSTEYLITNLTTLNNVKEILMPDWFPTYFNMVNHSDASNNSQTFFSINSWRLNTDVCILILLKRSTVIVPRNRYFRHMCARVGIRTGLK